MDAQSSSVDEGRGEVYLDRILAALDAYVYWQLSDQHYRNDVAVMDPGSDEPEQAVEIAACLELADRLAEGR